ncbi:MAG: hypothetical protein WC438_01725 [Candidatus Pacearchaeota archaeon]
MYQEIYSFIAHNKDIFRLGYSLFIVFVCLIIVLKTDKLFRLSHHQGIRYFRNAFFFYGIAFVLRYLVAIPLGIPIKPFFEFFMIMAGFFLLYSLLWKKLDSQKPKYSSLINSKILLFYVLAFVIASADYLWSTYNFMILSQIILFGSASIIGYKNYIFGGNKHRFLKLYFLVMIFSFLAWLLNFLFANFFSRLRFLANVYAINIIIFLIFLYGVIKLTKK